MANKKNDAEMLEEKKEPLSEIIDESGEKTEIKFDEVSSGVVIPDETLIDIKSNCFGALNFKGKDGQVSWSKCGEVQKLTMRELRDIKLKASKFFEAQWVVPIGVSKDSDCKAKPADIFKSLGIAKWYKNLIEPSNFKDICSWKESQIPSKVAMLSQGAKDNLILALNTYIEKGVLDSIKLIKAFELALNCKLRNGT